MHSSRIYYNNKNNIYIYIYLSLSHDNLLYNHYTIIFNFFFNRTYNVNFKHRCCQLKFRHYLFHGIRNNNHKKGSSVDSIIRICLLPTPNVILTRLINYEFVLLQSLRLNRTKTCDCYSLHQFIIIKRSLINDLNVFL